MAVYRTTFPIRASPDAVWDVLTDFERYPEWNPSLPSISGELRPGSTVSLTLAMPGRPSPKLKARLGDVDPGRRPVTARARAKRERPMYLGERWHACGIAHLLCGQAHARGFARLLPGRIHASMVAERFNQALLALWRSR